MELIFGLFWQSHEVCYKENELRKLRIPKNHLVLFILNQMFWSRSGMRAYAEAARRRMQLATVLFRPPSGHRPGRRQARHARTPQIGLRLAIAQADARPVMPVSLR